jgi:hypothetical protein
VPSAAAGFPVLREFISDSLVSLFAESLATLVSDPLRVSFPILIRSSFPGSLAGSASGSPGVPFPALLRVPLPVLRWLLSALFFWRISPPLIRKILRFTWLSLGIRSDIFVENRRFLWKYDLRDGAATDRGQSISFENDHRRLHKLRRGSEIFLDDYEVEIVA